MFQLRLLLLFPVLFAPIYIFSQSTSDLAQATYLRAEKAYAEGNISQAITYLDQTKEYLGQTNPRIEFLTAKIWNKQQDPKKVDLALQQYFSMASREDPNYLEMLNLKLDNDGVLAIALEREKAAEMAEKQRLEQARIEEERRARMEREVERIARENARKRKEEEKQEWQALNTNQPFEKYISFLLRYPNGHYKDSALLKAKNDFSSRWNEFLPEMIFIPKGKYKMGSTIHPDEGPIHKVSIKDFELGKTEVTFREYDYFCLMTSREYPSDNGWGRGNRPVINISWEDAQAYCRWLSTKSGSVYRLPTEAEWEYAAGGGANNRTRYAGTDSGSEAELGDYAWYPKNSNHQTKPVGQKRPNHLGLYDMTGNVWEWCQDQWDNNYEGASTYGSAREDRGNGSYRVYRGGSWSYGAGAVAVADYCRVAKRRSGHPRARGGNIGFRLARSY